MTIQDKDLLLVGVLNGSNEFMIIGNNLWYLWDYYRKCENLPPGFTYEIVSLYPGLTDEQCRKLVDRVVPAKCEEDQRVMYRDYFSGNEMKPDKKEQYYYSPVQSFASRMEALGAYIKNPMGEKEPNNFNYYGQALEPGYIFNETLEKWNYYQSRTSGQWLVLMKK